MEENLKIITVSTDFGAEKVDPRATEQIKVPVGTEVTFRAPNFVYLNKNYNELERISDEAVYRAKLVGRSIDGEIIQGTESFFQKKITDDIKVVWIWEVEYAVKIESASGVGLGNANPKIGTAWYPKDTRLSAAIDGMISDEGAGFRAAAYGYELENSPAGLAPFPAPPNSDYFLKFREVGGGVGYPLASSLVSADAHTVEFWGKIDRSLDSERKQVFVCLYHGDKQHPIAPRLGLFYGPYKNEWIPEGTTIGLTPEGRLFVEEMRPKSTTETERVTGIAIKIFPGKHRQLASFPAAFIGHDWHHWAFVFETGAITVYLDGTQALKKTLAEPPAINSAGYDMIGTGFANYVEMHGDSYKMDRLEGSLYNIRIWKGKREEHQIRDGMRRTTIATPIATGTIDTIRDYKIITDNDVDTSTYLSRFDPGSGSLLLRQDSTFNIKHPRKSREVVSSPIIGKFEHHNFKIKDPLPPADYVGYKYKYEIKRVGDENLLREINFLADDQYFDYPSGQPAYPPVSTPVTDEFRQVLRMAPPFLQTVKLDEVAKRVATKEFTIQNWLRIKWLWKGQVRYRFDAMSGHPGESSTRFDDQSFVKVYGRAQNDVEIHYGSGPNKDVWIDTERRVDVGAFYRTDDRCFTLSDFPDPPGGDLRKLGSDISGLTDTETIPDGQGNTRVSRIFEVSQVSAPTEIHWLYQPTVFRAEIPLGMALQVGDDPDDSAKRLENAQLVPALCEGAKLSDAGPSEGFLLPVGEVPTGRATGNPVRWDQMDKKLYPVQPGSNQIEWPDKDKKSGRTYRIEVVSGYPGDTVPLASERELPDEPNGKREGAAPDYVLETTLDKIDEGKGFPAHSENAHYRHLFDPEPERQPPTKLDISATDEWKFQELTYADKSTNAVVDKDAASVPFSSQGTGRSVVLYSYRPNRDRAADGNLDKEKLAVRVVRSQSVPIEPITPDDETFVLGQRGLELGGSFGIIQHGPATTLSVDPGSNFVIDFWLNAKGLRADDKPVTILSTGGDKLKIILDAATSTITAKYLGVPVIHPFSTAGPAWRHYIIHVFEDLSSENTTVVDFYIDAVRKEKRKKTVLLTGSAPASSDVGSGVTDDSLRFGIDADPLSRLQLDQFRLFSNLQSPSPTDQWWLTPAELRKLRTERDMKTQADNRLRGIAPKLWFSFEEAPSDSSFVNEGTLANVGLGPVNPGDETPPTYAPTWAHLDIQEVATRLESTLDNAGFGGSGYILNAVSNYNASLYDRDAEVGTWGPIFPVNHGRLYSDAGRRLEVAYYENPFLIDPLLHPNVAWPYKAVRYKEVQYPALGPHKDKAIYIASRIGSEGVDQNGRPQQIFDLAGFSDLKIYNQPDDALPGFKPNEEHALVAPSGRAALKIINLGDDIANNPPLAAFALQNDINTTSTSPSDKFEPWVLVQVNNLVTGEPEMAAYRVFKTRLGTIHFPRPSDLTVKEPRGLDYEVAPVPEDRFLTIDPTKSYDFSYAFSYPVYAGDVLIPPYPLNLVIGNVPMADARGGNHKKQRALWHDVNHTPWVVSGKGCFFYQYFYPFRGDFHLPGTPIGTPVAWVPDEKNGTRAFKGVGEALDPGKVVYHSFWRTDYPKLKRGETLTYQGGEYFNENLGSNGLPALVAMKAAQIVFDASTPTMILGDDNVDSYSARIFRPLDRHEALFTVAQMASAGFSPASASPKVFVVAERWYFEDLHGSLQRRFYFDSLAEKLVFRGFLNDKDSGDPDLTAGPDPLTILQPNVMTKDEFERIKSLSESDAWKGDKDNKGIVDKIFEKSQNPMRIRNETEGKPLTGKYLAGMKESPVVTERIGLNLKLFDANADLAKEKKRIDELVAGIQKSLLWRISGMIGWDIDSGYIAALKKDHQLIKIAPIEKKISQLGYDIQALPTQAERRFSHLDSLGVGSALVTSPKLLTEPVDGSRYVTIAENNRPELDGAPVSLHIIEIIPDRYRGAIKVIEAADAFSEKITLQHNGEFGANTGDLYYEWWIRDAAPLDVVADEVFDDEDGLAPSGTLKEVDNRDNLLWQQYIPEPKTPKTPEELETLGVTAGEASHLGLHSIVFEGSPNVILSDKLVLMRYRHKSEKKGWNLVPFAAVATGPVDINSADADALATAIKGVGLIKAGAIIAYRNQHGPFKSVDELAQVSGISVETVQSSRDNLEVANAAWKPGSSGLKAPFQWAGAANSPQLQADGGKRYIPQLVMGWVKRVLDRINPYEARYIDFFNNESPATYSSQIQIAGAPFVGKVALNPDKNVIENTGLIELYETVLTRTRELSIDNSSNPVSSDGINQALLLAATRLAVLYELLAREAYSDAQDSTITVTNEDGLASVASFTHAFQNMEADLLHEELALLRGIDFLKSYPVYNRLFWNYTKGLGEAAYNVNYHIYDVNTDGFINEDDARALYPQGHGDAWGHFVSALGMHYTLLQHKRFSWTTRSELYALMQNVLKVDYLDEKTFAKLAAGKARAGRDIVRGTYRLHYTQNPDGQWQGYTDGAEPARAWGVSEWAHRAGQAAYFDWVVSNSLLPDEAPGENPENLDRIERLGAIDEIGEIAGGLYEIQIAMDEANGGVNPLGFDSNAITFDIYPRALDGGVTSNKTHFEQIYERAVAAGNNALATLDFAAKSGNKLRRIAGDTDSLIVEAFRQDLDYRNRLIEIFGRPYDGTIGFGKVFPEGYEGPDSQLYAYLDRTKITQIIPETDSNAPETLVRFQSTLKQAANLADRNDLVKLYANVFGNVFQNLGNVITKPLMLAAGMIGQDVKVFTFGSGASELTNAFGSLLNTHTYEDFSSSVGELQVPVRETSPYAFQAPGDWGQRTSYGKLQRILEEELRDRIALESSIKEYVGMLQDFEVATNQLDSAIVLSTKRGANDLKLKLLKAVAEKIKVAKEAAIAVAEKTKETVEKTADGTAESLPKNLPTGGFSFSPGDALAPARGAAKIASIITSVASTIASVAFKAAKAAAKFTLAQQISDLKSEEKRMAEIKEINGLLVGLVSLTGKEELLRNAIGTHIQNLELKRQEYVTAQAEGFRLLREREAFNKVLAAKAQKNRYQDMIFRLSRNEAMAKYQSAFNHAARYAWLAVKAYDYETSLDPGHPAAPGALLDKIVKERQLGLWTNGQPQAGQGGLAEILNHLNSNFQVLKGQLGLNNPKSETEKISLRSELRSEHFRFGAQVSGGGSTLSDDSWKEAIKATIIPDLNKMPEFVRYCRPFANPADGPQPGIVIRFKTSIKPGHNVFGLPLARGDHNYSTANFATKVRGFGVWLENYNAAGLSTTPRAYLVPVGKDYMRVSTSAGPMTRIWSVQEQRIPALFTINQSNLTSPGFIPTLNGVDGGFGEVRRHGDFRMYHDEGGAIKEKELILDSRLVGRSVWNSEWLLIIPGAGLHVDPHTGLDQLAEKVSDIKLHFKTYSHQGQ